MIAPARIFSYPVSTHCPAAGGHNGHQKTQRMNAAAVHLVPCHPIPQGSSGTQRRYPDSTTELASAVVPSLPSRP
jgi:hypothetical protein